MTVLREVLARFGLQLEGQERLKAFTSGIDGAVAGVRTLGAALAGGAAVAAVTAFASHMAELGGELEDSSKILGINTQALQEWRYAAKLVGVGAEEMNGAMMILNRNVDAAGRGSKSQAEAFKRLGVDIRDSEGNLRDMDSILVDVSTGLSQIENGSERAGAASALFGRSGAKLLPLLAQGAEGVAALKKEFQELGGGATPEMIAAADEFGDEMDRLDTGLFALKARIAQSILPALTSVVNVAKDAVGAFNRLNKETHVVEIVLTAAGVAAVTFGVKFAAGFAGPIAIAGVFAAAIGFIILVIDDLITLFEGGTSVIGGFIDEMFGVGTAASVVQDLTDAWEGAVMMINDAKYALSDFLGLDTSDMEPPWWAKARIVDQGEISKNQDRAAALAGRLTVNKGETREQALERYRGTRREAIASGELEATREDVRAGLARRRGRMATVRRAPQAGALGEAQARTSIQNSKTIDNRTTNIIQVRGTDRDLIQKIDQRIRQTSDEQNARAAASLADEAVEEG